MITSLIINSLTLGTVASGYHFTRLSGFGFPTVDVDTKERGSYHGARLNGYRYGRRQMGVELEIIGSTKEDYETKRRALEQALDLFSGLATMQINTKSGLALQSDVIINADLGDEYQRGKIIMSDVRINFVAPYPFIQGQTEETVQVAVFDGGGFAIPFDIPLDMGTGGSGVTTVTNDGNGRAYPTIKIYGIIENPSIYNVTTGEALNLNYNLTTVGDYIQIDTYNRTVLLNGLTNIKKYLTPTTTQWLTLQAGANSLKLSGASSGSGANAEIIFRDSYLGV